MTLDPAAHQGHQDHQDRQDYQDHHDLSDGCLDDWSHHHKSGFSLRFPKICDRWAFVKIEAIKNILELRGHPHHHDLPDGC